MKPVRQKIHFVSLSKMYNIICQLLIVDMPARKQFFDCGKKVQSRWPVPFLLSFFSALK